MMGGMGGMGGMRGDVGVMERGSGGGFGLRTFSSLRVAAYRVFWFSMMAQMGAMNVQLVVRSLLMYELTGSAKWLGAVALANAIPTIALSLYGGVIADRLRKKYVLLVGQALFFVLALVTAVVIFLGEVTPWYLLGYGFMQGVVMALIMPSRQGLVRELVDREDLMNALSLNAAGMNINRLFAPVAAGLLVEVGWGVGVSAYALPYFAMAGLYLVATVVTAFLPKTGTVTIKGSGALADIRSGLQYIRSNTTLMMILLITLVGVVFSMPYMFLLPVFTKDVWHVGPGAYGILMSVSGIGAIAGSLVIASLPNKRRGALYLGSMLITGIALTLLAFSVSYQMALVVIVLVGVGQAGRMALSNTLVQYYTEEAYQGRVMSVYMLEFGLTSFSTFFVALLSDITGAPWAIGGCAIALTVLSVLAYVAVPRLRKLD